MPSLADSKILLLCVPVKKGGWNIGMFTRHLNADKVCPNQVYVDLRSMDTSDNVSMTLDFMTLFMSN